MVVYKMIEKKLPYGSTIKIVWETDPQSQRGSLSNENIYAVIWGRKFPWAHTFGKKSAEEAFNKLCAMMEE